LIIIYHSVKKKKEFIVRITDINDNAENDRLFESRLLNEELIGRLQSRLYALVDGHIYYNDRVIKIRYDLLENKNQIRDYEEHEIFDYYQKILPLDDDDEV